MSSNLEFLLESHNGIIAKIAEEVDDPSHLKFAKEEIYPMVIETNLEYLSK